MELVPKGHTPFPRNSFSTSAVTGACSVGASNGPAGEEWCDVNVFGLAVCNNYTNQVPNHNMTNTLSTCVHVLLVCFL